MPRAYVFSLPPLKTSARKAASEYRIQLEDARSRVDAGMREQRALIRRIGDLEARRGPPQIGPPANRQPQLSIEAGARFVAQQE